MRALYDYMTTMRALLEWFVLFIFPLFFFFFFFTHRLMFDRLLTLSGREYIYTTVSVSVCLILQTNTQNEHENRLFYEHTSGRSNKNLYNINCNCFGTFLTHSVCVFFREISTKKPVLCAYCARQFSNSFCSAIYARYLFCQLCYKI